MLHKAKTNKPDDGKQRKMKVFGPKKKVPSFPELHIAISGAAQSSNQEAVRTLAQIEVSVKLQ